ncbi:MAG: general secretion pathway protein GspD [Comamonadaceae bacterium]|nr:general secretion pathway protein GspD [Comamonadaceae bacterium]
MLTGRHEESVVRLEAGVREAPNNQAVRAAYFRQRDLVSAQLVAQAETERLAGRFEQAKAIYQRAQKIDPNQPRVRDGLIALDNEQRVATRLAEARRLIERQDSAAAERVLREALAQAPSHPEARRLLERLRAEAPPAPKAPEALSAALSKPITLDFRDMPIRQVFDLIARIAGVNFVFDKDTRTDTRITIFVRDTSMDEVMRLILTTNQLERKLLNDNTLLIYPDTPAKAREYQELVTRSFYLANADVKQAQTLIRTLVKSKDIFIDEKLNLLILKDTPNAVKLAERLIESLDMADPEVMLDVEVLEITRSRLLELGLRFPDQIGYGRLQNDLTSTIVNNGVTQTNTVPGGSISEGFIDLRNRLGLTSFIANPAVTLNLRSQAGEGNTLANPRIRVKNREKARIHIGDKLPVFTTTSTANVGVSASVSYLDVGLKLDVEPNISLDDAVAIKVSLEVSSVSREVPGPASSLAYQIGTRSASTVLRLRDGETQVLAGLISDEERSSANRLPGLGDIPVLGRLFSSQRDSGGKTEIVLLITPRILRNIPFPDNLSEPAGSEADVGAAPLLLPRTAARGLSMNSRGGAGAATAGARSPAARAPAERPDEASEANEETPGADGAAPAAGPATEAAAPGKAATPAAASSVTLTPVAPLPGSAAPTPPAPPAQPVQ